MIIESKEQIKEALEHIAQAKVCLDKLLKEIGVAPAPAPLPKCVNKIHVFVDAGHGGIHPTTGKYMTTPSDGKFYEFPDGFTAYEGQVNRLIADKFCQMLDKVEGVSYTKVYHEYVDTTMTERVMMANTISIGLAKDVKPVFMSFHSNASGIASKGNGETPRGWSVFIHPNSQKGLLIATAWEKETKLLFEDRISYRVHGKYPHQAVWEANFQILRTTRMPAALVECLFFTNRQDAEILYSERSQMHFAAAARNAVIALQEPTNYTRL